MKNQLKTSGFRKMMYSSLGLRFLFGLKADQNLLNSRICMKKSLSEEKMLKWRIVSEWWIAWLKNSVQVKNDEFMWKTKRVKDSARVKNLNFILHFYIILHFNSILHLHYIFPFGLFFSWTVMIKSLSILLHRLMNGLDFILQTKMIDKICYFVI